MPWAFPKRGRICSLISCLPLSVILPPPQIMSTLAFSAPGAVFWHPRHLEEKVDKERGGAEKEVAWPEFSWVLCTLS